MAHMDRIPPNVVPLGTKVQEPAEASGAGFSTAPSASEAATLFKQKQPLGTLPLAAATVKFKPVLKDGVAVNGYCTDGLIRTWEGPHALKTREACETKCRQDVLCDIYGFGCSTTTMCACMVRDNCVETRVG